MGTYDHSCLTISRKFGFNHLISGSSKWTVDNIKSDCWVKDQFNFSIILWSLRIGQLSQVQEQEASFYKDQLIKLGDLMQKDTVPTICGNCTNWQVQQMTDLLTVLKTQDPNPPDFIGKLVDEGFCKQSVRQYPGSMDENEKRLLRQRQLKYYSKNALKVLHSIAPFKNPQFPTD